MARIPISFYLNILAGILVLFNHYASSETGDVALNKVTGAAGRFYTLFRDTALTFQHGCTSHLQTALCGPIMDDILPHVTAEYLRLHYCHPSSAQDSSGSVDGTSDGVREPHGGYGSADFAFVYYRPPSTQTSAAGLLRQSPITLDWPSQNHLPQMVWVRSGEAMATIGTLLFCTCASWWWFRAPVKVTGILLAAYAALSALGYVFGANVVLQYISQAYMVVVADFLQCIEWEAQRQVWDISVGMVERVYQRCCSVCS